MNGPFLTERGMALSPSARRRLTIIAVGPLVVAGLETLRELAPRRTRMTAAARATFATAHRVVDRVHGDAAVVRTTPEPARAAGLAERDVLVIGVRDLADGGAAVEVHLADFAARAAGPGA